MRNTRAAAGDRRGALESSPCRSVAVRSVRRPAAERESGRTVSSPSRCPVGQQEFITLGFWTVVQIQEDF